MIFRSCIPVLAGLALALGLAAVAAQAAQPGALGPYDVTLLQGGIGLQRELPAGVGLYAGGAPWSMQGWVRVNAPTGGDVVVAALGDPGGGACDSLVLKDGRLALALTGGDRLDSEASLGAGEWHAVAASFDGATARLYLDGAEVAATPAKTLAVRPQLSLGPVLGAPPALRHFGGSLAGFTVSPEPITAAAAKAYAATRPKFDLVAFEAVGAHWPVQVTAWIGLQTPQDPWTLPKAATPPDVPIAKPLGLRPALEATGEGDWSLGDWKLSPAPAIKADGAALSKPGLEDHSWLAATVPGTVLTTLIDRGVYPDPDHGLNNMAIPESLARQAWWYRTEFTPPATLAGRRLTLTFKGINYAAEVWLNGERLGAVKGAFIRGVFNVTGKLNPGLANALAVRVTPPPHPGIPSEESIAYGPGENGGSMAIDGPSFFATEGWDWIPGIRDRDTGLWQGVELSASGPVRLLDPDVITHLPLPRTDEADLTILAPIDNADAAPRSATVEAAFDGVVVRKTVTAPPGRSEVRFDPAEFPALRVAHPRLWWPNGYGAPDLHDLTLTVLDGATTSDARKIHFGMREITYELSLFDRAGRLRRVEVDPTGGFLRSERLIDTRHEAINQVPGGWAQSLTLAGETSPAVKDLPPSTLAPFLVIKINGTAIAARGGSWGMDDSRKRVSRERLEPYFRLHQAAHLNIIRNWMGQDTEESFYDLADEYGMLVLNDFWESTQNFQLEAQDPALFLANARDVILRDRHHPSIAVWFGRNEGLPQPILNEGLSDLVTDLDGTRLYTGSSNRVNLQDSGPYSWRPPEQYFTGLAKGFAVEVGTPSLATLEAVEAMVPPADRWPISDTLAYHDWHFGGNGDVASFMAAITRQFGAPTSLEDFERKAQMLNYVDYRAIFEGFTAHLWTQNSGRLLWMSHPAWPSNHWEIYSADYDTQASYYGVMKAAEPLHVQMDLPDYTLTVVNTTRKAQSGLTVISRVLALDGRVLATREDRLEAAADQTITLKPLDLAPVLAKAGVALVSLELRDARGLVRSRNLYWQGRDEASLQALNGLAPQSVTLEASAAQDGEEIVVRALLINRGVAPVLAAKLTLVDAQGERILPAYYSDNYVSLLPGEVQAVEIRYPHSHAAAAQIKLRGWNVEATVASIRPGT